LILFKEFLFLGDFFVSKKKMPGSLSTTGRNLVAQGINLLQKINILKIQKSLR